MQLKLYINYWHLFGAKHKYVMFLKCFKVGVVMKMVTNIWISIVNIFHSHNIANFIMFLLFFIGINMVRSIFWLWFNHFLIHKVIFKGTTYDKKLKRSFDVFLEIFFVFFYRISKEKYGTIPVMIAAGFQNWEVSNHHFHDLRVPLWSQCPCPSVESLYTVLIASDCTKRFKGGKLRRTCIDSKGVVLEHCW